VRGSLTAHTRRPKVSKLRETRGLNSGEVGRPEPSVSQNHATSFRTRNVRTSRANFILRFVLRVSFAEIPETLGTMDDDPVSQIETNPSPKQIEPSCCAYLGHVVT
jgi:hypothetical protein